MGVTCSCGRVEIATTGAPIVTVACFCDDCQEAARRIEGVPGAPPVTVEDGGTGYVLYRKDRFTVSKGADLLQGFKLKPESPTNRMVARCCNAAMFLSFDGGPHWVSVYRTRFTQDAPPLDMRINTRFAPAGAETAQTDVPTYSGAPAGFILRLVGAKLAMLLRR